LRRLPDGGLVGGNAVTGGQRLTWVDTAKGLAIILVVIGHAWRGAQDAGLMAASPPGLFAAVDTRIYAFHMPLFFLLSGLFLVSTVTRLSVAEFVGSRVLRLFYPLVLWTYIFAVTKVLAGNLANTPLALGEVFVSPIPGRWQFWFLWALFVLQIGVLVLRPALRAEQWRRPAIWGLLLLGVVLQTLPLSSEVQVWTSNATRYLPYLALGMVLAEFHAAPVRIARGYGLILVAVFAVVLAAVPDLARFGVPSLVSASILVLSSAGIAVWMAERQTALAARLADLGRYSMIIFLSHTIFSAAMREGLIALGFGNLVVHMVLSTSVGLVLPIGLQRLFERFASPRLIGV